MILKWKLLSKHLLSALKLCFSVILAKTHESQGKEAAVLFWD